MSVTIPSSVTKIGGAAFTYCTGLRSVTIPEGVTIIGYAAFSCCAGLRSVTIPESVTSIQYNAFYGCTGLWRVAIPSSVTSIESGAFQRCSRLTSVYCYIETPLVIKESTFSDRFRATLYVPADSKTAYEAANYWRDFKQIVPLDEPSAITDIEGDGNGLEIEAIYDLNGQRQPALRPGINIIKMSDGTIKKVMVK